VVLLYQPMSMELETDRLTLRPWAEGDAEDYRALIAERDDGAVSVETARERIVRSSLRPGGRGSRC
jgi:hypothetical protein